MTDYDVLDLSPSEEDLLLMTPPGSPRQANPSQVLLEASSSGSQAKSATKKTKRGSSTNSKERVITAHAYPPIKPKSLDEKEFEKLTKEGVWFRITFAEYNAIPFLQIRESKKKRYTVYLRNGDSVKVKLIGTNAPLWYSYKARSNRTLNNRN